METIADQKKWGCRVTNDDSAASGQSYAKPIFDFDKRRQFCLDNMKAAYDAALYGNDERVLYGSWRELFGEDGGGEEPRKKKQKSEQDKS